MLIRTPTHLIHLLCSYSAVYRTWYLVPRVYVGLAISLFRLRRIKNHAAVVVVVVPVGARRCCDVFGQED